MKLSFYDEDSFKEAVGSLCLNTPLNDLYTLQRIGSTLPRDSAQDSESDGDSNIKFNNHPSDLNILRRVGNTSSSSLTS